MEDILIRSVMYNDQNIKQLRKIAKERGIKKINAYRKVDLIAELTNIDRKLAAEQLESRDYKKMKIVELKNLAREKGLTGFSKYNKNQLIALIKNNDRETLGVDADKLDNEGDILYQVPELKTEDELDDDVEKEISYISRNDESKIEKIITTLIELGKKNKNFVQDITVEAELTGEFGIDYDKSLFLLVENNLQKKSVEIDYTSDDFAAEIQKIRMQDTELAIEYNLDNITLGVSKKQNNDLVRQYLSSINDYPLLKPEKELEYGKLIFEAKELGAAATKQQLRDAQNAREQLQLSNKRLVVSVAKIYVNRGLDLIDLIHEGTIGLIRAIDKYDYRTGYKFATYATWWVRQGITRAIADKSRVIRVPVHMVETINKVTKVQRELLQKLGQEPTYEQIGMATNPPMSPSQIEEIFKIARDPISLEMPVGEDNSSLEAFIEDDKNQRQEEYSEENELRNKILEIIDEIPDREGEVIKYRYGLYNLDTEHLENQVTELSKVIAGLESEQIIIPQLEEHILALTHFSTRHKVKYQKRIKQNSEKYINKYNQFLNLIVNDDPRAAERIEKLNKQKETVLENNLNYLNSIIENLQEEITILHKINKLTGGTIKPLTLEEVGELFAVTRERIRQIESKGRRKLKSYAEKERLDLYI